MPFFVNNSVDNLLIKKFFALFNMCITVDKVINTIVDNSVILPVFIHFFLSY